MGEGGSVAVVLEVTSEQHLVVDGMQVVPDLEVDTGHHTVVDDTLIVAGLEVAAVHHVVPGECHVGMLVVTALYRQDAY